MDLKENYVLMQELGAYFLGAVYLSGVIAAGLVSGNRFTVAISLFSAGSGYLTQIASLLIPGQRVIVLTLWFFSVGCAIIGGLAVISGGA